MDTQSAKQRHLNMDLLRIACCFLIVLLHFSSSYLYSVDVHGQNFKVMTIYNSLTRISVPIFIMLSGYFLLDPGKEISVKKYVSRPLSFLVTVYLWSAFYAFQGLIFDLLKTGNVSSDRLSDSLVRFVHGHYHMWFCFLLAGYYFLLPIARKIAEDIRVLTLFIVLWVVFSFAVPCIFSWLNMPSVSSYFDKYELYLVRGYFGYFLLGYFIKKINIIRPVRIVIYVLGIISLSATAYFTISQSASNGSVVENWLNPGSPLVLIASFAAFLFFKELKVKCSEKIAKVIPVISGLCFFIYIFHVFILEKLNLLGLTTVSFNPIISIPALTILAFLISLAVAFIVSKIPFINRLFLYSR